MLVVQESVLELKVQETREEGAGASQDSSEASDSTQTIFLDVPSNIGSDIKMSRKNLMTTILKYETDIERLEELWAKKVIQ